MGAHCELKCNLLLGFIIDIDKSSWILGRGYKGIHAAYVFY